MKIIDKCLNEIDDLEEGVLAEPAYKGKKVRAKLKIDMSDESNLSNEAEDYFYMLNKHELPTNLKKVSVKIDDPDSVDESEGQGPMIDPILPLT